MIYRTLSDMYGGLRGFNRAVIRREAAANASRKPGELDAYAGRLFHERVHSAISSFRFYAAKVRAFMGSLPASGDVVRPEDLPVWTKNDQEDLFRSLTALPVPGSFLHATGGSTGIPTRFYMTRESYEWRMAVADRGYAWAGAEEGRRSYYIWGVPIQNPSFGDGLKETLTCKLQRRRFFNSFLFDDERKRECCAEINRYKPEALVGYAGRLVELARFMERNLNGLSWRAKTVVTAAEGLGPGDRERLEEYLGDEVFMSYGSREFMLIGMECGCHRGYHISSDNLLVEVVDENGKPLPHGETGRILVTDLHNIANPFIRYEIGDLGVMSGDVCQCGLPFPILERVEGRLQDVLYTTRGDTLTGLFAPHLLKEFRWIKGFQIVQQALDSIRIRVICDKSPSEYDVRPIVDQFRKTLGRDMAVIFERVDELETAANGKTPPVIVRMDAPTRSSGEIPPAATFHQWLAWKVRRFFLTKCRIWRTVRLPDGTSMTVRYFAEGRHHYVFRVKDDKVLLRITRKQYGRPDVTVDEDTTLASCGLMNSLAEKGLSVHCRHLAGGACLVEDAGHKVCKRGLRNRAVLSVFFQRLKSWSLETGIVLLDYNPGNWCEKDGVLKRVDLDINYTCQLSAIRNNLIVKKRTAGLSCETDDETLAAFLEKEAELYWMYLTS